MYDMLITNNAQHSLRVGVLTVCTGRYCAHLEHHLQDVLRLITTLVESVNTLIVSLKTLIESLTTALT